MRHQTLWPRGQWGQQKPHKSHYNSNFVLTICIFFLKAILPDPDRRVSITEVLPSVLPCIFLMWLKRLNFLLAVSPQCVHWKGFNFSCTVRMCALWFRRCVNVLSQKSHLSLTNFFFKTLFHEFFHVLFWICQGVIILALISHEIDKSGIFEK